MVYRLNRAKLNRNRPLRDQIYVVLRDLIVTGVIEPGETIDEKDIAARLDISRTPVREAVKKLSDENLVDVIAQSGTRAAKIDRNELHQAFLIRRALEMESAAQAAAHMSAKHEQALAQLVESQTRATQKKKFSEALDADDQFHRYIAGISNLPRLWRAIEISKAHLDRCRHTLMPRTGEAETTLAEHRAIIAALASKNSEKARTTMAAHLDHSYSKAVAIMDAEGML